MEASVKKPSSKLLFLGAVAVLICIIMAIAIATRPKTEPTPQIDIAVTLEKIVNISDLSTVEFEYQGIVEVPNPKKPANIDYYICYTASIYAGIDFSEIQFEEDKENKTITAVVPEVKIQDIVVDPNQLDFMFMRKKSNNETVMTTALTACEADIQQECTSESAFMETAQMNADNAVRALAEPIIESVHADYTLVIKDAIKEEAVENED